MANKDERRESIVGGDQLEAEDNSQLDRYQEDAKLFYERKEQTGELIDVEFGTDLASLPPKVTHVRYPDGTIEHLGYS
jgi:hypothetical protein